MTTPDLTPDHPAVEAADAAVREKDGLDASYLVNIPHALTAALPHLTADDLPARLARDIQVRTIRAAARAVTYEEDDTPQSHDWDRATVAAWLNGLADNIEDGDA